MKTMQILVPLAEGFEEIEAIVPVDVWRRAGFEVLTAGLKEGVVTAARQTRHCPDVLLAEVLDRDFDLIYLPGGRPGADHLAGDAALLAKLKNQAERGAWIAAICAAPLALEAAGLLAGKRFTCHPSAAAELKTARSHSEKLVVDGRLVTGQAAGASFELALELVKLLAGPEVVEKVNQGLLYLPRK